MTIHQTSVNDARRSPREDVNTLVDLRTDTLEDPIKAELDNVSLTGFLVWTDVEIDEGANLVIVLDPDGPDESSIELSGVVVRVMERDDERRPYGFGCEIGL